MKVIDTLPFINICVSFFCLLLSRFICKVSRNYECSCVCVCVPPLLFLSTYAHMFLTHSHTVSVYVPVSLFVIQIHISDNIARSGRWLSRFGWRLFRQFNFSSYFGTHILDPYGTMIYDAFKFYKIDFILRKCFSYT